MPKRNVASASKSCLVRGSAAGAWSDVVPCSVPVEISAVVTRQLYRVTIFPSNARCGAEPGDRLSEVGRGTRSAWSGRGARGERRSGRRGGRRRRERRGARLGRGRGLRTAVP